MLSTDAIRSHLGGWSLTPPIAVESLVGGINSQVWLVRTGDGRFVAKAAHPSQLLGGLEVAELLEARGFWAGSALRTPDGQIAVPLDEALVLALLRFVPGRPLDRSKTEDRARIGRILGEAHSILLRAEPPPALARWPWHWLTDFEKVHLPPRVAAAISGAVRDAEVLVDNLPLTQGILHGDVAGRDFLFDEQTAATGLVDWGGAMIGPLLYDLGSFCALARINGADRESFLAAYVGVCPLSSRELAALDAFVTFRWAVQARYFGWRLARNVMTGIADERENEKGFRDALEGLGVP